MVSIHHDDLRVRFAEERVNEGHRRGPAADDKVVGLDRLRVHRSPSGSAPRLISGTYSAMSARASLGPSGKTPDCSEADDLCRTGGCRYRERLLFASPALPGTQRERCFGSIPTVSVGWPSWVPSVRFRPLA